MMILRIACCALVLAASGCSSTSSDSKVTTMTLGPTGGTVGSLEKDGVSVAVPAGALSEDVTIKATSVGSAPAAYDAASPVFRFEPEGTVFSKPITVTFAMTKPDARAVVYFTKLGSDEYEPIGGVVSGNAISAQVTHFSGGFAAVPAAVDGSPDSGALSDASAAVDGGQDHEGGTDAGESVPDSAAPTGSCPPAGTYTMTSFKCGNTDITAGWKAVISKTTITFSTEGNACRMNRSSTGTACVESQEDVFVFGPGGSHASLGITACIPAMCTFTKDDAPCVIGDRAQPTSQTPPAGFEVADGKVTIRTPANSMDICGAEEGIQVFDSNPPPEPTSKLTNNGNGTVSDSGSGLRWQQTLSSSAFTWDAGAAYCAALSLGTGAWRLPTLEELKSIIDNGYTPAHIHSTFFPDTPAEQFWTSSANGGSQHWYVDFANGLWNARSGSELRVRCVQ